MIQTNWEAFIGKATSSRILFFASGQLPNPTFM